MTVNRQSSTGMNHFPFSLSFAFELIRCSDDESGVVYHLPPCGKDTYNIIPATSHAIPEPTTKIRNAIKLLFRLMSFTSNFVLSDRMTYGNVKNHGENEDFGLSVPDGGGGDTRRRFVAPVIYHEHTHTDARSLACIHCHMGSIHFAVCLRCQHVYS